MCRGTPLGFPSSHVKAVVYNLYELVRAELALIFKRTTQANIWCSVVNMEPRVLQEVGGLAS